MWEVLLEGGGVVCEDWLKEPGETGGLGEGDTPTTELEPEPEPEAGAGSCVSLAEGRREPVASDLKSRGVDARDGAGVG